jgi:hypothetical protein
LPSLSFCAKLAVNKATVGPKHDMRHGLTIAGSDDRDRI